jgi:hypothetical protein
LFFVKLDICAVIDCKLVYREIIIKCICYQTWTKYAQLLKERLQNPNTSETSAKLLADLVAQDQAFAKEFVVLGGFEAFLKKTENEKRQVFIIINYYYYYYY